MKALYESLKIAFSMYSKIPVPKSNWTKKNMEYSMCFFPLVGAVIAILFFCWYEFSMFLLQKGIPLSSEFITCIYVLLPVVVTGGIHLDGLLDTADALSSYQSKERKLEILKDSHAGAFAIIVCCVYFIADFGILSMISEKSLLCIGIGFVLSRAMSGLAVVTFPLAKGTGLAATFQQAARKKVVAIVLGAWIFAICVVAILFASWLGVLVIGSASIVYGYYYRMARKQFGGITGDLAGFFLQVCEIIIGLVAVIGGCFL